MKKQDDDLDELIEGMDLSEKTEMGEFASEIHKPRQSGSNISSDESSASLVCKMVFPALGMTQGNIVDTFLELSKSRQGWATEKVVQGAGGIQNNRAGGSIGGWMKDKLFTPK